MARRIRSKDLETRSARLRLARRKKPYYVPIMRGVEVGYRRNKTAGTFNWRDTRNGVDLTERIGVADDYDDADDRNIFTFWQAGDFARERARVGMATSDLSIKAVVERYQSRGGDPRDASRVLLHLEGTKLSSKLVTAPASSLSDDLREFRNRLAAKKLKPATIDRITTVFKAALNAAADNDERITRRPWKTALKAIGSDEAGVRNVILDDVDTRTARGAAYRDSEEFGLLYDLHYETGARSSQIVRLTGEDVQADFIDPRTGKRAPRLMMPTSRKGRSERKARSIPVPISVELASRLKGRSGLLLKRADGGLWDSTNLAHYFANVVKDVKFNNQAKVTLYALRHTSIVRQLVANVPIRIVAALHDTSVTMIERTYSKYIADVSDELARATLPKPTEIVSLDERRAGSGA